MYSLFDNRLRQGSLLCILREQGSLILRRIASTLISVSGSFRHYPCHSVQVLTAILALF